MDKFKANRPQGITNMKPLQTSKRRTRSKVPVEYSSISCRLPTFQVKALKDHLASQGTNVNSLLLELLKPYLLEEAPATSDDSDLLG